MKDVTTRAKNVSAARSRIQRRPLLSTLRVAIEENSLARRLVPRLASSLRNSWLLLLRPTSPPPASAVRNLGAPTYRLGGDIGQFSSGTKRVSDGGSGQSNNSNDGFLPVGLASAPYIPIGLVGLVALTAGVRSTTTAVPPKGSEDEEG